MSDLMVRRTDPGEVVGPAEPVAAAARGEWARHVEPVVQSLQARFGTAVEPELIRTEVAAEFAAYSAAPVRDFIPILVEARVRSRLLRMAGRGAVL